MAKLTYLFYQYSRLRLWMERAPWAERWPWYVTMLAWTSAFYLVLG